MTLLERYVFRRALANALGALASLVLIVWIVQALSRIDIVKSTASAAGNVFWIALMLLPDLAAGIVPFAVLIGAVQALNSLNADSERSVMAAAGASPKVVAKPIVILGVLGGVVILLVAHVIGPAASRGFRYGIRAINADTITLFLQPGRFEKVQNGLELSIGAARGNNIQSLFIADSRDPNVELVYFAREARISKQDGRSLLLLSDGQLHRRDKKDGSVAVVQFQSYAFDLADLKPANTGDWIRPSERSTTDLISPNPADKLYREDPGALSSELTDRMTNWLYAIAFALWAVVVAAQPRTNRQATSAAMTLGLVGGLGLKALGFVALAQIKSDDNTGWTLITYLLPLSAILLDSWLIAIDADLTQWRIYRQSSEGLQRFGEAIGRLFAPRKRQRTEAGQ
ncbi:LptF/LptG family permease [Jiella sp. MQZ9-1]|uniref:LptF/LptG family permease n=1 Tax=Jiella flava TaxID=2816857 RepID=A0A939FU54_9HYPH|nr:LptF/LptG family permease [Jiella flava]MBO0661988.1 LptF/LptG family permease [Jiella flava]MCD2470685.1 LptF/LptG family permease [Jiella flava]